MITSLPFIPQGWGPPRRSISLLNHRYVKTASAWRAEMGQVLAQAGLPWGDVLSAMWIFNGEPHSNVTLREQTGHIKWRSAPLRFHTGSKAAPRNPHTVTPTPRSGNMLGTYTVQCLQIILSCLLYYLLFSDPSGVGSRDVFKITAWILKLYT